MDTLQSSEIKKRSFFRSHKFVYLIFFIFFICIALYYLVSAPTPSLSFVNKQGVAIHISPNQSHQEVALELEEKKVVKVEKEKPAKKDEKEETEKRGGFLSKLRKFLKGSEE